MAYANQEITGCAVECKLKLGEVSVCISAEHDAGQDGLQFEGGFDPQLDIDKVIGGLRETIWDPTQHSTFSDRRLYDRGRKSPLTLIVKISPSTAMGT